MTLGLSHAGLARGDDTDARQVYSPSSPEWLRAVGKLEVPGSRWQDGNRQHHVEDCTATLVDLPGSRRNRWLLTAWHCLEFYTDLSRPIIFTLPHDPQGGIWAEATIIASGGAMHKDWALLRLDRDIDVLQAPPVPLGSASGVSAAISMAGYSRDEGLGQGGSVLTYDERCQVLEKRAGDYQTDCTAFKGASGGAVIEATQSDGATFAGVISRGDSASVSIFVPIQRFLSQLAIAP